MNCPNPSCECILEDKDLLGVCPKCQIKPLDYFKEVLKSAALLNKKIEEQIRQIEINKKSIVDQEGFIDFQVDKIVNNRFIYYLVLISGCLAFFGITSYSSLQEKTNRMVLERLDKEFGAPNIQDLMNKTANKYTEQIISDQINQRINSVIIPIKTVLNSEIAEVKRKSDFFSQLVKIKQLETASLSDSRSAFENLQKIVAEKSNFSSSAEESINLIKRNFMFVVENRAMAVDERIYGFNGQKFTMSQVGLSQQLTVLFKVDMMTNDLINARIAIEKSIEKMSISEAKGLILQFLIETKSLVKSVLICSILSEKYDSSMDAFQFDQWIKFLKEN